jgi:hypothetical protein
MFSAALYKNIYNRFLGPLAQDVIFQVNNGTGFDPSAPVKAMVTKYKESDLVSGGSIELGDLKLIIPFDPAYPTLGLKDRIEIDGRTYGVVHWDTNTRSVGEETIAIEATVRG